MTRTILLDLDDTLLGNSLDNFIPAYIKSLAQRMAPLVPPEKLVPTLMAATQAMVTNPSSDRRLEETFGQAFYPVLGLDPVQARPLIDQFYAEDFPKLRPYTRLKPESADLVHEALAKGYRVAVATAPLFPRTAIWQRLEWAGLPVESTGFALVSSYEGFHFTKPHPAYYTEFLAQLGWPEGPVVMVGDDPKQDIQPARTIGLPVFWTPPDPARPWEGLSPAPPQGSLADVFPWLEDQPDEILLPHFNTPTALKAILRSTPAALDTLFAAQDPNTLPVSPAPNEWSATEILCHLRDAENEVNLPRVERILREANPFIAGRDTDAWAEQRQYIRQSPLEALQAFTQHRLRLMAILDQMEEADWQRQVRHAIFGPTNFQEILRIIADHDRLHIQQLFQGQHIHF